MAHKTLIGGTAYEITGGKTLVNGTAYSIKSGKTLVDGTAYEVGFGPSIFSFTINGVTYYAEDGMRWNEWVESQYNTGGYVVSYNVVGLANGIKAPDGSKVGVNDNNTMGISTGLIVEGHNYTHNNF